MGEPSINILCWNRGINNIRRTSEAWTTFWNKITDKPDIVFLQEEVDTAKSCLFYNEKDYISLYTTEKKVPKGKSKSPVVSSSGETTSDTQSKASHTPSSIKKIKTSSTTKASHTPSSIKKIKTSSTTKASHTPSSSETTSDAKAHNGIARRRDIEIHKCVLDIKNIVQALQPSTCNDDDVVDALECLFRHFTGYTKDTIKEALMCGDANTGHDADTSHDANTGHDADTSHDANTGHDGDTSHDANTSRDGNTSHDANTGHDADTSHDANTGHDADTSHDANTGHDADTSHDANTGHDADTSHDANTGRDADTSHDANTSRVDSTSHDANTSCDGNTSHDANTSHDENTGHDADDANTSCDGNTSHDANSGRDADTRQDANTGRDANTSRHDANTSRDGNTSHDANTGHDGDTGHDTTTKQNVINDVHDRICIVPLLIWDRLVLVVSAHGKSHCIGKDNKQPHIKNIFTVLDAIGKFTKGCNAIIIGGDFNIDIVEELKDFLTEKGFTAPTYSPTIHRGMHSDYMCIDYFVYKNYTCKDDSSLVVEEVKPEMIKDCPYLVTSDDNKQYYINLRVYNDNFNEIRNICNHDPLFGNLKLQSCSPTPRNATGITEHSSSKRKKAPKKSKPHNDPQKQDKKAATSNEQSDSDKNNTTSPGCARNSDDPIVIKLFN